MESKKHSEEFSFLQQVYICHSELFTEKTCLTGFVVIMCNIAEIDLNSRVWLHLQHLEAYQPQL